MDRQSTYGLGILGRTLSPPLAYVHLFLRHNTVLAVLTTLLSYLRYAAVVSATAPTFRPAELYAISIVLLAVHFLHETVVEPTLRGVSVGPECLLRVPVHPQQAGNAGLVNSSVLGSVPTPTFQHLQQPQAGIAVVGLVRIGVAATAALILSAHLSFHLLRHFASRNRSGHGPSPLATAGVVAFLVTQSLFPVLLVLNGAYASWAGEVAWFSGGTLTAALWGTITIGLYRSTAGDGW